MVNIPPTDALATPAQPAAMAVPGPFPASVVALHYATPTAILTYYAVASLTAACLLHKGSAQAGAKRRRYGAAGGLVAAAATVAAECLTTVRAKLAHPHVTLPQDYVVYLVLSFVLLGCLAVGVAEDVEPVWHIHVGTWVAALVFETALLACGLATAAGPRAVPTPELLFPQALRVSLFFGLSCAGGWFLWSDSRRRIMLGDDNDDDEESRSLLRSERAGSDDSDDSDDDGDLYGFLDYDEQETAEDFKELRKQQRQRLEESGSWLGYLKAYKIFLPILWPAGNRKIQACLATTALSILGERALNLLVPRQLGLVSDALAEGAGDGVIPWRALGLWMVYAALNSQAGLPMIKEIAQVPVRQNAWEAVVTTSFAHIMNLSMDFHNEKSSGELIRAVEQGAELHELLEFALFTAAPVFVDLALALVFVYVLFDVYMTLLLLLMGAAYVGIGIRANAFSTRLLRDYNRTLAAEGKIQNEAINSWPTVAQFNRAKYECDRYADAVADHRRAAVRYYIAWSVGGGLQSVAMTAGHLAATALAAYRVANGEALVGRFIALATYWVTIEQPLFDVTYSVRKITQMLTNSERLLKLLSTQPSVVDAPDATELRVTRGAVEFDDVEFAYDPRRPILRGISFAAAPGETIALVGETGGGKSTLLKLLYRYFDVGAGAVRIDGQDVRGVTLDSLRAAFAVVPQDPALFNVSIGENVRYARPSASDAEVEAACRAAAVHERIAALPDGYATAVGERGVKLSGGELQRVAIARALLRDAPLVLLDEATSMIDAATEAAIQTALTALTRGRTTFVVAHRLSTVRRADRILVIRDGAIAEQGTHDDLVRRDGLYARLWEKQVGAQVDAEKLVDLEEGEE